MSDQSPVITLRSITKRFGIGDAEHYALNGVDLTIKKGEFVAIMGPSGCGKTTLLNIIGLLDRATDGDYLLDGKSVEYLSARRHARIRSEYIGFVFQNFNLIPRLTIIENVALPLTYKGVRKIQRLEKASRILKNFHLQEREYYMPYQLSGGQTQRVAIARALVNNPSIILADEPTGNLDSKTSHIIMEELADVHRRGNTIIMVTHNPDLTSYASRVITMLDGTIDTDSDEHKPLVSGSEVHALKKPLNSATDSKSETTSVIETATVPAEQSPAKKPKESKKSDTKPESTAPVDKKVSKETLKKSEDKDVETGKAKDTKKTTHDKAKATDDSLIIPQRTAVSTSVDTKAKDRLAKEPPKVVKKPVKRITIVDGTDSSKKSDAAKATSKTKTTTTKKSKK